MLEDLDFADDMALLSSRHTKLGFKGKQIGLNINTSKTKLMKINTRAKNPVTLDDKATDEVQEFIYLGGKITSDGNSENDVLARIALIRGTFASLRNIWKSSKIGINTKLRIVKSNVLGVLLYGADAWKLSTIISRIDVFQTKCLRSPRSWSYASSEYGQGPSVMHSCTVGQTPGVFLQRSKKGDGDG